VVQQYRSVAVTRDDIRLQTQVGIDAVKRLGEPAEDIMSGTSRSSFSPALSKTSVLALPGIANKGANA
jgi:hypothetical protein